MTELLITPKYETKEARFKGTVAAGEVIAVTIVGGADWTQSGTLRLRVVGMKGDTLAQFPEPVEEGETAAEWAVDTDTGKDALCQLNLDTANMLYAVPRGATIPFLFVLDDPGAVTDGVPILYFKDMCYVTHWPQRTGEDNPVDLRGYRDFVQEAQETITQAQAAISDKVDEATGIVAQATAAKNYAQASASAAAASESNAAASETNAANAQTAAETAQAAAETAQGKAEDAQSSAETAESNAEAWATGGSGGTPSATNNAKYYSQQAISAQTAAETAQGLAEDARDAAASAAEEAAEDAVESEAARAAEAEDALGDRIDAIVGEDEGSTIREIASEVATSAVSGKANTADLITDGKIKSSLLPSFVDDVLEYESDSYFPSTGETGKIYVDKYTNKTYRWGGSSYVEISQSLALGETSSTAFRGDLGKVAYDHATDPSRITTAQSVGLYKVAVTDEGHVKQVSSVEKTDITALGIPAQDTTYGNAVPSSGGSGGSAGLMSAADKEKLDGIPSGGGGGSVTVDDHLDDSSTNPVQNKVVTEAVNAKCTLSEAVTEVTRTAPGEWQWPETFEGCTYAPSRAWLNQHGHHDRDYYTIEYDGELFPEEGGWAFSNWVFEYQEVEEEYKWVPGAPEEAIDSDCTETDTTLSIPLNFGTLTATRTPTRNVNGLARLVDLPTKTSDLTNDGSDGEHPFLTSHQTWSDVKPSGGIPATDLASAVQASLGLADTAVQPAGIAAKMPMYPFVTPTFAQTADWFTFSGNDASTGNHWECVYDNGVWGLYDVPDGSTWEDVSSPSDFIVGTGTETSIAFQTAGVTATLGYVATVSPYTVATYTATSTAAAFEIAVGALPAGVTGKARDCILVIDCTATGAVAPTVTWGTHFHPRTDTATDLAIVEAGKRAVFYISEYVTGEFAVGGWQETAGGSGT